MAVGKKSAGCSNRSSSEAAADESTGGVAPGYVEDGFEGRTKLGTCFRKIPQNGQNDRSPRPQQVKERGVALRYVERIERSENDGAR